MSPSISVSFPDRPLRVRPPGAGLGSRAWAIVVALLFAAGIAALVVPPIGDLVDDFAIAGKAQPVPDATVDGRCSVHAGVLTRCSATLTAPGGARRKVDYFFVDFHAGAYHVDVVADPARPQLVTTDLALDKLWNRALTLGLLGPLFVIIAIVLVVAAGREVRAQRAIVKALDRQRLRPTLLRMGNYRVGHWTVTSFGSASHGREWRVPRSAAPIVMDPAERAILGVTAGDGLVAMPLDRELRWIGLEERERTQLTAELGPDRLGRWLSSLATPALEAERTRFRRAARGVGIAGVVLLALGAGAAFFAFREREVDGPGARVELVRGDEAAPAGPVKLVGVRQMELAAKTTRIGSDAAHLEVWVPVTAEGWRRGQAVSWIVEDVASVIAKTGRASWAGSPMDGGLPERARTELVKQGVVLAPVVHVLAAVAASPDPLYWPLVIAMGACGAIGLGLVLGALANRARARRIDAILG